ncbi:bacteriohemerythrin [Hominifimenecus sp. rT4P-3]|uniref:bacteriohemerythrin n=1 Tax=Hominifimenecus sp. rT4P-3 TaxID=3242979 RepID=UPI003DA52226
MYAEFDESLVTGNEMIDSQHKVLIEKINDLVASCEEKKDKLNAVRLLNYLADYTEFHFTAEEKLQAEIGYPGIAEHKEKHDELRRTVEDLHQMLEDEEGPSDAFVDQLNKKVIEWLYYHIKGFDRSVAEYRFMRDNTERL